MSENISHVSDGTFETEVLNASTPVLVDFWAPWCGPCRAIAPILDEVAQSYAGRMKVVKLDVDQNQKTAVAYNIRSIPTMMVFKGGKVEATQMGAVPKGQITRMVEAAL